MLWKPEIRNTNEVQASHMGDRQSSVAAQNIFDVTALEILLESKQQILGQTLPYDSYSCYCFIIKLNRYRQLHGKEAHMTYIQKKYIFIY